MAVKSRSKQSATFGPRLRKAKFQADLAPAEDGMVRALKGELQLNSNTDFLSDALALFRSAVSERKLGHRIVSETPNDERKILVLPRLERVAPDFSFAAGRDSLDEPRTRESGRTRLSTDCESPDRGLNPGHAPLKLNGDCHPAPGRAGRDERLRLRRRRAERLPETPCVDESRPRVRLA